MGHLGYLKSPGNSTLTEYRVDRTTMATIIAKPRMFWTRVFLYFPISSSLLRSNIRNVNAAGNRVTAITCTKSVIRMSGALGIKTTAAAVIKAKK